MVTDKLFETKENMALISICTRKMIQNIGTGGVIWGILNIAIGIVAIQVSILNIGLLMLGVVMLATGIYAIRKPSLGVLLTETIVTALLFAWNVGIGIINFQETGALIPRGLILPLIITCVFANYYRKLGHLREQITAVDKAKIEETKQMCKILLKKKLKSEPYIIEANGRICRIQLMEEGAFFIHRNLMRAFIASMEDVRNAIVKPDAKSLKLHFNHPVAKLQYQFNKKNSGKLNNWLATASDQATEPSLSS